MKTSNNKCKITVILIVISFTILLFSGCGSSKSDSSSQTTKTSSNSSNHPDMTSMKTVFSNALKTLVSDNTITQAQCDKVLEALTKDIPQENQQPSTGTNNPQQSGNLDEKDKQNGTPPSGTPPTGTDKQGTQPPSGQNPSNQQIASLVTDGVITQAQADKINTKIAEVMKNSQSSEIKK